MTAPQKKHIVQPGEGGGRPTGRLVGIGVVAFLLQVIIAPNIAIAGISPNFLLIACIIIAMTSQQRTSTIAGFVLGLLFDLLSVGPVGGMALVMALVGFVASTALANIQADNIAVWLIVSAIICFAASLVFCIVLSILGYEPSFFGSIIFKVVPWTLYDLVICAIAWPLVRRLTGGISIKSLDSGVQL